MKRFIISSYIVAATLFAASAQNITYEQYMKNVLENNTALVARGMDIEIARAAIQSKKTYNDPTLSLEYGNNEDWNKNLGQSIAAQLGCTFTFGVRRAGINLAEKEAEATKAVFYDYMRNLHADATIAYLQHLKAKALLDIATNREAYMQQLSLSDSLRFQRGEIAKTAWIETRLAAGLMHNERLAAEAELHNSAITLGIFMSNLTNAQNISAEGSLNNITEPLGSMENYIDRALNNRADLQAAYYNIDIAEAQKKLNSTLRRTNLQLSIGGEYNKADPSFTKLKVGASIPLKFSNLNKGARIQDKMRVEQATQLFSDRCIKVQSEIMQAYNNCRTAEQQTATFTRGMLDETSELLANKRKAYEAGEISFIEFIETERSENMMQAEYIESLYNKAACWVELQRSIGHNFEKK